MVVQPKIEQLAERPELLSIVAAWIYNEWWTAVDDTSLSELTDLLRTHLTQDEIPLTLVASLDRHPVGTASLLVHDAGTEQ